MLLLDVGNSRIKWAQVERGLWVHYGAADVGEWSVLRQAFANLPPPHRILVSNVAGANAARLVREACAVWNCPIEFISAQSEQCGVRSAYDPPGQLGSDRWAALIGAWHLEHAATLVVSCGTATTIDALSGAGEFLGGLILPGVNMMRRSLAAGTAQLGIKEENRAGETLHEFPRNTADAIASGAIQATVGAILQQYALLGIPGARCLLSGGAAGSVQPYLGLPVLRVDNLVLQGLQIIGQESLQNQEAT